MCPRIVECKDTGKREDPPAGYQELVLNRSGHCLQCGHRPEGVACCICGDCICCPATERSEMEAQLGNSTLLEEVGLTTWYSP